MGGMMSGKGRAVTIQAYVLTTTVCRHCLAWENDSTCMLSTCTLYAYAMQSVVKRSLVYMQLPCTWKHFTFFPYNHQAGVSLVTAIFSKQARVFGMVFSAKSFCMRLGLQIVIMVAHEKRYLSMATMCTVSASSFGKCEGAPHISVEFCVHTVSSVVHCCWCGRLSWSVVLHAGTSTTCAYCPAVVRSQLTTAEYWYWYPISHLPGFI